MWWLHWYHIGRAGLMDALAHDDGNFMEDVSNDRHCNNTGCGTGMFQIPCTETPQLFFNALLLHCPPSAPCITRRDYTFLVNHLWCALGFLSLRIGFLEDAPSLLLAAGDSKVYSPNIFHITEKFDSLNCSHMRLVISIVGKYLKHFDHHCHPSFISSWFLITILQLQEYSIETKDLLTQKYFYLKNID